MDPGDPSSPGLATEPAGDPASECPLRGRDPRPCLQQPLHSLCLSGNQQQEEAWQVFAALDDPRVQLLDLLEGRKRWRSKSSSPEAWITRELQHWLQAAPPAGAHLAQGDAELTQLQARACCLIIDSPPGLVEPLVSIFELQDTAQRPLLGHIQRLQQEGKFKEAVLLGMKLKLQPELDVEKMSVPLLLQNDLNLVERYVAGFPELQRRLLGLMDSWCRPGFKIGVVARQYPHVACQKLERLNPRELSRQVLRLQKHYGLDPALCPHAVTQRRLAALRYLCHKRFVEGSLSQEDWVDFVQDLVGQSEWLQKQLLRQLDVHNDAATVARCALDLSLPVTCLPAAVAAELGRLQLDERTVEVALEDQKDDFYQLPIPRGAIHVLASSEDLGQHEARLLQPGQVVGVDLEWRPFFGVGDRPRPSLMQVAVDGHVFLLDLLRLWQPPGGPGAQAFCQLVSRLLSDPSITKLGYELAGDLRRLGALDPSLAHAARQLRGAVDLQLVHQQMREREKPNAEVPGGPRGLSLLVQQVLGKPLDKAQQISNWDRRPLSEGQRVYAAADVYSLLEVYRELAGDLASNPGPGSRESHAPQEASALPPQEPAAAAQPATPEVPVRAFRVVCDNMLGGLARCLRCLGADVTVLGARDGHRRAAEVALQEERIILTSGQPYHQLRSLVGPGRCLAVDCSLKARQQAAAVLRHFRVRVTPSDIFHRCQACNSDQYLKISRETMEQLVGPSPGRAGDETTQREEPGSTPEEAPGGYTYDPPCPWLELSDLRSRTPATLPSGARLQLAAVPAAVLRRTDLRRFFCCAGCGKVFWEGSHLGRVLASLHQLLDDAPAQ
ncbi:exonuclease mut-7 homolog isoform X2 [Sorex araneus]|uniref:exonuclease mut-7 homolog isoform X2 n=1 Tax=Sorex araneus TaxID=42254 RepID=UPI00243342BC|nr:exonuclease mut-7 homolog isoform X2 [Sorex araneus]